MIGAFLLQLSLFTTLYSPNQEWNEKTYSRGIVFIPLIGLILGLMLYTSYYFLPVFLRGFTLVALYCILSGGLHLDGFSDTLDGILARRGAVRALEIMKDPHLGTFGILGLFLLLIAYFSYFPLLGRNLILLPALGRFGGMLAGYRNSYARQEGMGKFFINSLHGNVIFIWMIILSILAYYLGSTCSLLSLNITFVYSFFGGRWFKNHLGGMTGDTVGFMIESSQLFYIILFLLVKQWI
ncbi:MAG: adenosylcobinamide-GDP ribazoletransferase [Tissierellia bacterium]|nr:adenosylcobinamide-GDP ribazoletransferase [Tissierellia bacterium]